MPYLRIQPLLRSLQVPGFSQCKYVSKEPYIDALTKRVEYSTNPTAQKHPIITIFKGHFQDLALEDEWSSINGQFCP